MIKQKETNACSVKQIKSQMLVMKSEQTADRQFNARAIYRMSV